jgi:hypothetical protein
MLQLASSVTAETTSMHQTLFEVALLTLMEPWMETVLPEERELFLAVLFDRCFVEDAEANKRVLAPIVPASTVYERFEMDSAADHISRSADGRRSGSPKGLGSCKAQAAEVLSGLVEQLTASTVHDPAVLEAQQRRNAAECSDVTVPETQEAWRRSLEQRRLADEQLREQHRAVMMQSAMPRDYRHHSAPQSYDLERVLLQRLTRQIVETGPTKTTKRAEQLLTATKHMIPPQCRRQFALRNHQAVGEFRTTVEQVALRECGVQAIVGDVVALSTTMALPKEADYAKARHPEADAKDQSTSSRMRQRIHRFFVQMPLASSSSSNQTSASVNSPAADDDNSEQQTLLVKPRSRPSSAVAARPTSACTAASSVAIFSPFSDVAKMPQTLRPMSGGRVAARK